MKSALSMAPAGPPQPRPSIHEIDVYGLTHPGLKRTSNEDHFLIGCLGERLDVLQTSLPGVSAVPPPEQRTAFIAAVADGVGGGPAGEEASRRAVEAIALYVAQSTNAYFATEALDDGALMRGLEDAALRCHAELLRRVSASDGERGMATTLTLWLGVWPRAYLLQVGDSRYYVYREGTLSQISRDQTVAQELIEHGILSVEDAARTRWAHVLSSAIGGDPAPVVTSLHNDRSTVHLLCSDGLTRHVDDARIRERLAGMRSARDACEALLADALDGGGADNITIIVGRVVER